MARQDRFSNWRGDNQEHTLCFGYFCRNRIVVMCYFLQIALGIGCGRNRLMEGAAVPHLWKKSTLFTE